MGDLFTYSLTRVFGFSLVFIRMSGLCAVSPFFGTETVPKPIRMFFALAISFIIFPTLNTQTLVPPDTLLEYGILVVKELLIGLMIGLLMTAIFVGFEMGGRYMSIHMGLAMAQIIDPESNKQSSVVGQFLGLVVLTIFVIVNGHHFILNAIYESFVKIPIAGVTFSLGVLDYAVKVFNVVIVTSLKIAVPTMAALFAMNLLFGFIARLVPRMNVFIISIPAKIAVGIIIISVALPAIVYLLFDVINEVVSDVYAIIAAF